MDLCRSVFRAALRGVQGLGPEGSGSRLEPSRYGSAPGDTVIQPMFSRGYLFSYERPAGSEYALTPKALVEIGSELGYEVEATHEGPPV